MKFVNVTWTGPKPDDEALLAELPDNWRAFIDQEVSGFIQFAGGLHFRGACAEPEWHSLRAAWRGKSALRSTYSLMTPTDVPLAQDYLGNQFILRNGNVLRISGETGRFEPPLQGLVMIDSDVATDPAELPLEAFLMLVQEKPECLGFEALDAFLDSGGSLAPGQLLHVYPPLCSREARAGVAVSLKAMDVAKRLSFLAKVVEQAAAVGEGESPSFPLLK